MNQSMNDEAVCRTAPATPGLSKRKTKWVDDLSCMVALHLPSSLVVDTRPDIPRPVPYRGRHGLMLPRQSNSMQDELDLLNLYAKSHKISVNHQKTKIMLFLGTKFSILYQKCK
jgi:hypothetical protein